VHWHNWSKLTTTVAGAKTRKFTCTDFTKAEADWPTKSVKGPRKLKSNYLMNGVVVVPTVQQAVYGNGN